MKVDAQENNVLTNVSITPQHIFVPEQGKELS